MGQDKQVNEALGLIDKIQHRLVRRHMIDLITLFLVAGLTLASIPLTAGKFRIQDSWLSLWLPPLTVALSVLGGAILAWTSRPNTKTAARTADRALGTKELFLTALSYEVPRTEQSAIAALFGQDLKSAVSRSNVKQIVPSRLAPAAKFLAVMIFVDALLLATPNLQKPESQQIDRIQNHLTVMATEGPLLSEEDRATFNSLQDAKSKEELEAAAVKMWQTLEAKRKASESEIQSAIEQLKSAIAKDQIERANEILDSIERQLAESGDRSLADKTTLKMKELASLTTNESLVAKMNELDENGNGSGAGKGGKNQPNAETQSNRAKMEWMNDILVSVFSGMGKELPDVDSNRPSNPQNASSPDSPLSRRKTNSVTTLRLNADDQETVEQYLRLRQSRR
ncbi:MAG: hypothetical protein ACI97A_002191 [Planctomycetota bacterium]|jgi:hypothetical protein